MNLQFQHILCCLIVFINLLAHSHVVLSTEMEEMVDFC